MESKFIIRERGKAIRAALGAEMQAGLDERIVALCQTELDWADYERVMLYLPIERQHEINTWPLVRWIWANWPAVAVYAPVTRGERMAGVQITPLSTYKQVGFGIAEPVEGDELRPDDALDVIITPLLGFDRRGYRVGYGAGYYDRFLPAYPGARRIGLGYEALLVPDGVAAKAHDVRLQGVITQERMLTF